MTSNRPRGSVNLEDLLDLLAQAAVCANDIGIPQSIVDRTLRSVRLRDGATRGWSNPLTAAVVDLTERQIRNIKRTETQEAYDAELEDWDERHKKGHPIHQMMMATQQEPMTCGDFAKKLRRKEEHVLPFIREAVDQGYLEMMGSSRPAEYLATRRVFLYERSSTVIKRFGAVERASAILWEIPRAGRIQKLQARLAAEGIARVREYFDPRNPDFPTLLAATRREQETHEERGRTDLNRSFGSVVTFGSAGTGRETPMETTRRHALDYPHAKATSEVLPTRAGLDDVARRQYLEQDFPAIVKELKGMLAEAAKLGDGEKQRFELVVACAPTPVAEELERPVPESRPSHISRVAALLALVCPLLLLGSGCGGMEPSEPLSSSQLALGDVAHDLRTDVDHGLTDVEFGDSDDVEHGNPDGVEHGGPDCAEHGHQVGVEHGDPAEVEHGDPEGVEHGDPDEVEHGDPDEVEHGDPEDLSDALKKLNEDSRIDPWDSII